MASSRTDSSFDPAAVMRRDVHRLKSLRKRDIAAWRNLRQQSEGRLAARRGQRLEISYPSELPISQHAEEITRLIGANQVVVVAGETGSGKTTQLPKMCLAAGYGYRGMIGHTQPRRLAARAVAARVAEELGVPVGEAVGYAVRFSDQVGDNTLVKLVTDGLLLNEIRTDRFLDAYEVIIVDEAHERSLNVDFLLGYLRRLLERRRDLRVIITSATIDVAAFAKHFGGAPVVEVGGRGFPVQTFFADEAALADRTPEEQIVDCIRSVEKVPGRGAARDILVFQSGEREIFDAAHALRRSLDERYEILPLYARLSARDQQRIFKPSSYRRVVIATNVAETSLTVPNIGFVIDPGLARISRYSYRSKLQRLPVEPISQASADQRRGRCGRVAPGVCYRLYTEHDYLSRPRFTDPEIKRTNLAQVVLQMRSLGLGKVAGFPFLDPPDPRAIRDAERLLNELGALEGNGLTETGRMMARLPVDPRLARMIIAGHEHRALSEVLVIVSALAAQDPRERPLERQGSADRAHLEFADPRSDFLAFLNIWQWYLDARQSFSRARLGRELGTRFLSATRMREWHALHRQLLLAARELNLKTNQVPADYAAVHRALLQGSLSLVGLHEEKGGYLGPRNLRFRIFPGSALARRGPKWLMAGEITETRRIYARCVAGVEARWIEEAAGGLVKRRYSEPRWSARRGEVIALETVTLYGLPLADGRRVSYQKVDPDACRELFITEGLVRGGVDGPFEFLLHNRDLVLQILDQESKGRRRDLLIGDAAQADLYAARLPREVCSVATLKTYLKQAGPDERERLKFSRDELLGVARADLPETDFPSVLEIREVAFPLSYRFAPGEPDDGVSVTVPVGMINSLVGEALEWGVPGFFDVLVEQWLRTLPKAKRRVLAPLPDRLGDIVAVLRTADRFRHGRLLPALGEVLADNFGLQVGSEDWDRERVDPHLLMNVRIVDGKGDLLAQGRELGGLQSRFAAEVEQRMASSAAAAFEVDGLTAFPEEGLAESVSLEDRSGHTIAYPALVDAGDSVSMKLFADARQRDRVNRDGYARLALISVAQTARLLKRGLDAERRLGLLYSALGGARQLTDELLRAAAWSCFFADRPLPSSQAEFEERLRGNRAELAEVFAAMLEVFGTVLEKRFEIVTLGETMTSPAFRAAVDDVLVQLDELVPADVLSRVPRTRLADLPRYLDAARYRLEHLQGRVERDEDNTRLIASFRDRLRRLEADPGATDAELMQLRFAVEELRVTLFAEPLGARGAAGGERARVSPKRLDRSFDALERALGLV